VILKEIPMQSKLHATLSSDRLILVAITPELIRAEQKSVAALAACLGVDVPPSWPPEHWEASAREFLLKAYEGNPQLIEWHRLIVLREPKGRSALVGMVGAFRADPGAAECEMGYTVAAEFHGRGIATEAAGMFLTLLREEQSLKAVVAHTYPNLLGSIRVLEKCGFVRDGLGEEVGTIRFRLQLR
jgi:RimJ/RimL family protein N-acetyltransferase